MRTRLDRLFDIYGADFARYFPQYPDHFGCPVCHRMARRAADLRTMVAEEHIIPSALGGRLTTLSCRKCNNRGGTVLEPHLIQRVLVEARRRPARARVRIGSGEFGAEFHDPVSDEEPRDIVVIPKQSDPRRLAEAMQALEAGATTINMTLNFGYVPLRSVVALVRSAHLMMFRHFGYSYALDKSAKVARRQIAEPHHEKRLLKGITWRTREPIPVDNGVLVLREPPPRCFLVVLTLDRSTGHKAVVALPAPGSDGSTLYSRLGEGTKQVSLVPMPPNTGFLRLTAAWRHFVPTS